MSLFSIASLRLSLSPFYFIRPWFSNWGGRCSSFSLSSKQSFSKWRATCFQCFHNYAFGCIGFGVPICCTGFYFIWWSFPFFLLGLSFYFSSACRLLYIIVICSAICFIDCCAISSACLFLFSFLLSAIGVAATSWQTS